MSPNLGSYVWHIHLCCQQYWEQYLVWYRILCSPVVAEGPLNIEAKTNGYCLNSLDTINCHPKWHHNWSNIVFELMSKLSNVKTSDWCRYFNLHYILRKIEEATKILSFCPNMPIQSILSYCIKCLLKTDRSLLWNWFNIDLSVCNLEMDIFQVLWHIYS